MRKKGRKLVAAGLAMMMSLQMGFGLNGIGSKTVAAQENVPVSVTTTASVAGTTTQTSAATTAKTGATTQTSAATTAKAGATTQTPAATTAKAGATTQTPATTTQTPATTTQTLATTTAQSAVTTASAAATTQTAEITKDTGFGYALMNGEVMALSFATATTIYIPVTVENAGYMKIVRNDVSSETVTVSVLEEDKKTELVAPAKIESLEDTGAFAVGKGSYFIKVEGTKGEECEISLKMTTGVEMKQGKNTSLVLEDHTAKTKYYLELQAEKTGLMTLENRGSAKVSVTLCDENKTVLSGKKALQKYSKKNQKDKKNSTSYGVQKGNHYLVCVSAASSVKKVTLKYSIKGYASVGGNSFANAKTLKSGKTVSGTMAAKSGASYYKFTKSSYSQKRVELKTMRNQGKMKITLYYKEVKGKKKGSILPVKVNKKQIGWTQKGELKNTLKIPGNWPKVTYYLKITNVDAKSNGCYQLKVK